MTGRTHRSSYRRPIYDKFTSMELLDRLKSKARAYPQRIVLPEGEDERVIRAAAQVTAERYAQITLQGARRSFAQPPIERA